MKRIFFSLIYIYIFFQSSLIFAKGEYIYCYFDPMFNGHGKTRYTYFYNNDIELKLHNNKKIIGQFNHEDLKGDGHLFSSYSYEINDSYYADHPYGTDLRQLIGQCNLLIMDLLDKQYHSTYMLTEIRVSSGLSSYVLNYPLIYLEKENNTDPQNGLYRRAKWNRNPSQLPIAKENILQYMALSNNVYSLISDNWDEIDHDCISFYDHHDAKLNLAYSFSYCLDKEDHQQDHIVMAFNGSTHSHHKWMWIKKWIGLGTELKGYLEWAKLSISNLINDSQGLIFHLLNHPDFPPEKKEFYQKYFTFDEKTTIKQFIEKTNGSLIFTGHSLGGWISSQLTKTFENAKAYVFSTPGQETLEDLANEQRVFNFVREGDPVFRNYLTGYHMGRVYFFQLAKGLSLGASSYFESHRLRPFFNQLCNDQLVFTPFKFSRQL